MESSDTALLRKWQRSSDSEAFAEIVRRHSSMVFATCNRILRNEADAEDVTQECFMELGGVRRLIGDSLGGLLHTLATHRSLDRLKGESRRREREIRYAMGRPTSCTIAWDDLSPHIDEAIANLPMKYRDAVIRHFLEGQTHVEIARTARTAESTVRYRIQKGIERIRVDLRHRGVIVSTSAMGKALGGSRSEAISANLAANLGKLSLAGATSAASAPPTAGTLREAFQLRKVLGVLAIAGLVGLLLWGLHRERATLVSPPASVTQTPSVVAPDGEPRDEVGGLAGLKSNDLEPESIPLAVATDGEPEAESGPPTEASPAMENAEEIVAPPLEELRPERRQEETLASTDSKDMENQDLAEKTETPLLERPDTDNAEEDMGPPIADEHPEDLVQEKKASTEVVATDRTDRPVEQATTPEVPESAAQPLTVAMETEILVEEGTGPEASEPVEPPIIVARNMEPIHIELPEAFFGGTPLDYWGPNLEEPDYKARAPFLAPLGTARISLGKPVTASSEPTMGVLRQLTDGDKDYAKTSLVELPEGLQWVQVDLEAARSIYAVLVWHFHEGNRVYFDLVVQLSDDPDFKEGVTTLYNNDYDNSAGLGVGEDKEYIESNKGRLIDAKGVQGRYLRIYGKGNTANNFSHFIEVEVWGK
jgi:RNA polymerase sigma factor (sigma-70 family)